MNSLRLSSFAPSTNKILFGLYWLSFGGFIFLNNLLIWLKDCIFYGKSRMWIYVMGKYCPNKLPSDIDGAILISATFIGLKFLIIPAGWLLYKRLKNAQLKALMFEVLICFFLFDLVFLIWYPVLQLFDIDLTWYYFSAMNQFYLSFLLGLPDLTIPAFFALQVVSYLLYFKPFTFKEITFRVLLCSFSLAFFISLFEILQYLLY